MWKMYAGWDDRNKVYRDVGEEWYTRAYGHEPIAVDVKENPEGIHYGWIATGKDKPVMIYGAEFLLEMCFAYGSKIEVEHGKGRIVRLDITPSEVESQSEDLPTGSVP